MGGEDVRPLQKENRNSGRGPTDDEVNLGAKMDRKQLVTHEAGRNESITDKTKLLFRIFLLSLLVQPE